MAGALVAGFLLRAGEGGRGESRPTPVRRFTLTLPASDFLTRAYGPLLAFSPDGGTLVYSADRGGVQQLFRRPLDELEATPMPGTEGGAIPFFSPDGRWIAFTDFDKLSRTRIDGRSPQIVVSEDAAGGHWTADDRIVLGGRAGPGAGACHRRRADGALRPRAGVDLLSSGARSREGDPLHLAAARCGPERAPSLLSGDRGASHPARRRPRGRVLDSGHLVFARQGALWAVPFDAEGLVVRGDPVPVVEDVRTEVHGAAQFAISGDGSLAYIPTSTESSWKLLWVDRRGAAGARFSDRTRTAPAPRRPWRRSRRPPFSSPWGGRRTVGSFCYRP